MQSEPLLAHSVAEIHLYLMARQCEHCRQGPLQASSCDFDTSTDGIGALVSATCDRCHQSSAITFNLPPDTPIDGKNELYPTINPTGDPSQVIDVGQWLVLFRVILEAASKETRKIEARRLGFEAAQCLTEAIKFYDDNDLPPESAVFTDSTRKRLRDHPEHFSKQHLIETRAKLPKLATMKRQIAGKPTRRNHKRRWWKWGRDSG